MGILSGSSKAGPVKNLIPKPEVKVPEACDRCGYSKTDDLTEKRERISSKPLYSPSERIADAKYKVVVPIEFGEESALFFCGHHFRKYEAIFAAKGYSVSEVL
jgi:hypothetical protein